MRPHAPVPPLSGDVAVMIAIPVLTVVDLLLQLRWAVGSVALVTMVFIVRQAGHVSPAVRRTSVALVAVTAVLLPLLPAPGAALERGVRIGALIADSCQLTADSCSLIAPTYNCICAPISTTRLGGSAKKLDADTALRAITMKSRFRQRAIRAGPSGSRVSRPR